jgi:hypothetical protein
MRAFLKRFVRHRPAVLGLVILLAVTAFALLAPAIHPASPFSLIGKPFGRRSASTCSAPTSSAAISPPHFSTAPARRS